LKTNTARAILRVVLPYVVLAGLWILFSDALLLGVLPPSDSALLQWSIIKGLAFVVVTGLLLSLLLHVELSQRMKEQAAWRESTERMHAAEAEVFANRAYLQSVLDSVSDAVFVHDGLSGRILDVNRRMCEMYGVSREEALRLSIEEISLGEPPYSQAEALEWLRKARETGPQTFDWQAKHKDGHSFWVEACIRYSVIGGAGRFIVAVRDITDRRRAERERENLQMQLNQARKMESVGRLAGGVAHDFNNLLMGIMGYVELCRDEIRDNGKAREYLDEIMQGARRSAELTRQLLAFARRQPITPVLLDLNETVTGVLKLLRRLIGEDISLAWSPGAGVWPVRMDPGQVDQLLANLCVNARDAIGDVGRIRIETSNVTVDEDFCRENAEAVPGPFVVLAVSDDGCGMDRAVLEHIFEPFFTTKGVGQGTGLGLATVYGIVKQNRGFIKVSSEAGRGTSFRIYLPKAGDGAQAGEDVAVAGERPCGVETILLVEDEKAVRVTTMVFLEQLGYRVLAAESPAEALRRADSYAGPIHLLVTDVVMPGMSGGVLAAKLAETRPGMKCLYISGYTADEIRRRSLWDSNTAFLTKPFSRDAIARKVREVLDPGMQGSGDAGNGAAHE